MLMPEEAYIDKGRVLKPAEDWSFLRGEGLQYIELLAHGLWTDYNSHDPGITILEALCYAITELGYRSSFDAKDLLADEKGAIGNGQAFFTPRQILTNEPYSVTDYRKLLIDIKGVNNAWLYPAINTVSERRNPNAYKQSEVPLYPECKKDRLTYRATDHEAIDLRGLYRVKLDLDNNDSLGDLNSGNLDYTVFGSELRGARIECSLPRYDEVDFDWLAEYYNETPDSVSTTPVSWDNLGKSSRWTILLVYKKGVTTTSFQYDVQPSLKLPRADFEVQLEQELKQKATQQQIMELYYNKTVLIKSIVLEAWQRLHAHRNLCEDWGRVDTIKNTPVALCADVDVRPSSDIEKVYGAIIVAVEEYLNPPLKFYSLKELQARGEAIETIFEGPPLHHGFLLDDELENAKLRSEIHVSDLINIIMDVEGVIAIKNILLTKYDDGGKAVLPSQKWCLHIDDEHKPVLDIERSKLLFFKAGLPYKIKAGEGKDTVLYLRGLNTAYKIIGGENDLPLPIGTHYALDEYSPVQYDLPDTYGTGKAGLPATVSEERKAQAKQLKSYLLFYDQLLAGFFSQIRHAKDLLGLDEGIVQSYFQQFLADWNDDEEHGIRNVAGLYADAPTLRKVLSEPQAGESIDISKARQGLVETEETFYDRRNRFLDHLIARFSESFNDYALTLHASKKDIDATELIRDKIRFLKEYPESSRRRGTAYNILGEVWNTDNVSGLEKRVSGLTGINDAGRRNLFCYPLPEIINEGTDAAPKFTFALKDKKGVKYLKPLNPLESYEKAERLLNDMYENMRVHEYYVIKEEPAGNFKIFLTNNNGVVIAICVRTYKQRESASRFVNSLIKNLAPACDEEGLHLIENFLLRPLFTPPAMPPREAEEVYRLMKVCLPNDCLFCGEEDPYSFRVSLFLPYWPVRFRDANFRRYFETTARREAPAHVHLKVCWLSFTAMHKLEIVYQAWLNAVKAYRQDQTPDGAKREALRKAGNDLIAVMDNVTTVYPEATLHDCDEGTTNPVRLGSTNLGSF